MRSAFKKILHLSVIFLALLYVAPVHAIVPQNIESIMNYDVQIEISKKGEAEIRERINYDFGRQNKRGIIRTIPYVYRNIDGTFYLPNYTVLSVRDESGNSYPFATTTQDRNLVVRIGDPKSTVTGQKTYEIVYRAEGVISYFSTSTEFNWNAIGTDSAVPVLKNTVSVSVPGAIVTTTCYAGEASSTRTPCVTAKENNKKVSFSYANILNPYEGLTIVVGMPANAVVKPDLSRFITSSVSGFESEQHSNYVSYGSAWQEDQLSPWIWPLPFLTLGVYIYLWSRFGREPKGKGVIVPHYEPPDKLSPLQMGTVIDGHVDNRDLSAQIIDFAVRGYIKITEQDSKEYILTRLKDSGSLGVEYERRMLEAIFTDKKKEVKLSDLKYVFYTTAVVLKKDVRKDISDRGYLLPSPYKNIGKIGCAPWFVMTLVLIALAFTSFFNAGDMFIAWVFCSAVALFASFPLGRHFTAKGAEVREYIKGFKLFLSVTEQERLKFHNAPEKKPELFEKFLPYAMVLGVEREWAEQFKDLYTSPPNWYEGGFNRSFSPMIFSQHMATFSSVSSSALVASFQATNAGTSGGFHSTPSSSSGFSGGSSGGGFGGGGVGSW